VGDTTTIITMAITTGAAAVALQVWLNNSNRMQTNI